MEHDSSLVVIARQDKLQTETGEESFSLNRVEKAHRALAYYNLFAVFSRLPCHECSECCSNLPNESCMLILQQANRAISQDGKYTR